MLRYPLAGRRRSNLLRRLSIGWGPVGRVGRQGLVRRVWWRTASRLLRRRLFGPSRSADWRPVSQLGHRDLKVPGTHLVDPTVRERQGTVVFFLVAHGCLARWGSEGAFTRWEPSICRRPTISRRPAIIPHAPTSATRPYCGSVDSLGCWPPTLSRRWERAGGRRNRVRGSVGTLYARKLMRNIRGRPRRSQHHIRKSRTRLAEITCVVYPAVGALASPESLGAILLSTAGTVAVVVRPVVCFSDYVRGIMRGGCWAIEDLLPHFEDEAGAVQVGPVGGGVGPCQAQTWCPVAPRCSPSILQSLFCQDRIK